MGGDPHRFQALTDAYRTLAASEPAPSRPVVARGTPSRPYVRAVRDTTSVDLASIDWDVAIPQARGRLDRDRVAVWLAADGVERGPRTEDDVTVRPPADDAATGTPRLRRLVASSRAPRSRLNRVAHLLAPELTTRLEVAATHDDRGQPVVAIEIVGGNRRARRALDRVGLQDVWTRTRRSTTTQLRSTVAPSPDPRATAVRVSARLVALLDALAWPLEAWTLERS